jgi:iron complex transport system ATP-binding protein
VSPAAELEGASVTLAGRTALSQASLTVSVGEIVGVVGANGAGKTTLLRAVLGLAKLSAGLASLGGQPVAALSEMQRAGLAGYLPQERRVAWNMPAWRIAALGAASLAPRDARERALTALKEMGLAELAERGVRDMSGGERARVLIARLFATEAPLLVADEPTAGLDPDASLRIMEALRQRAARGAAVLATLHDLTLAARGCDRLVVLNAGRIIAFDLPETALSPTVLSQAFALEGGLVDTPAGWVLAARRGSQVPDRTAL